MKNEQLATYVKRDGKGQIVGVVNWEQYIYLLDSERKEYEIASEEDEAELMATNLPVPIS